MSLGVCDEGTNDFLILAEEAGVVGSGGVVGVDSDSGAFGAGIGGSAWAVVG